MNPDETDPLIKWDLWAADWERRNREYLAGAVYAPVPTIERFLDMELTPETIEALKKRVMIEIEEEQERLALREQLMRAQEESE